MWVYIFRDENQLHIGLLVQEIGNENIYFCISFVADKCILAFLILSTDTCRTRRLSALDIQGVQELLTHFI